MINTIVELFRNRPTIGCSHPQIYIDGFRDGAKADYKCVECGFRVYPKRHDTKWVYDSDGIYTDAKST